MSTIPSEDEDLKTLVAGCDLGKITQAWIDAYKRRLPLLLRTMKLWGWDDTDEGGGLRPRQSIRAAASFLLAD